MRRTAAAPVRRILGCLAAGMVLTAGLAGCAGNRRADLLLDAGDHAGAAALYQEMLARDSLTRQRRIEVLSTLALIHSQPGGALYDRARAAELLQQLFEAGAGGSYRLQAQVLLDMQRVVGRLSGDMSAERRRVGSLTGELEGLQSDLEALGSEMGAKEEHIARLNRRVQQLARSVEELTQQLSRREDELRRLKAIDLAPPP